MGLGHKLELPDASARSVSAWLVDGASTLDLMGEMYRQIADGAPTPSALATAQRCVASRQPHPYYWAAFTYVSAPPVSTMEVYL